MAIGPSAYGPNTLGPDILWSNLSDNRGFVNMYVFNEARLRVCMNVLMYPLIAYKGKGSQSRLIYVLTYV